MPFPTEGPTLLHSTAEMHLCLNWGFPSKLGQSKPGVTVRFKPGPPK